MRITITDEDSIGRLEEQAKAQGWREGCGQRNGTDEVVGTRFSNTIPGQDLVDAIRTAVIDGLNEFYGSLGEDDPGENFSTAFEGENDPDDVDPEWDETIPEVDSSALERLIDASNQQTDTGYVAVHVRDLAEVIGTADAGTEE